MKWAAAGAVAGIVGLSLLVLLTDFDRAPGEPRWGLVAVLIFAIPYILALASNFIYGSTRISLLAAAALASSAFTLILFSFAYVLLPATLLLFYSLLEIWKEERHSELIRRQHLLAALFSAGLLVTSFVSLHFWTDQYCWSTAESEGCKSNIVTAKEAILGLCLASISVICALWDSAPLGSSPTHPYRTNG